MTNQTKTILSLILFFPFGIYLYLKTKDINSVLFTVLLIIGILVFVPLWVIIISALSQIAISFGNNILLPLVSNGKYNFKR